MMILSELPIGILRNYLVDYVPHIHRIPNLRRQCPFPADHHFWWQRRNGALPVHLQRKIDLHPLQLCLVSAYRNTHRWLFNHFLLCFRKSCFHTWFFEIGSHSNATDYHCSPKLKPYKSWSQPIPFLSVKTVKSPCEFGCFKPPCPHRYGFFLRLPKNSMRCESIICSRIRQRMFCSNSLKSSEKFSQNRVFFLILAEFLSLKRFLSCRRDEYIQRFPLYNKVRELSSPVFSKLEN